jgi:hypothetical protein
MKRRVPATYFAAIGTELPFTRMRDAAPAFSPPAAGAAFLRSPRDVISARRQAVAEPSAFVSFKAMKALPLGDPPPFHFQNRIITMSLFLDIISIAEQADKLSSEIRARLPATDHEHFGTLHRIGLALHELARNTEHALRRYHPKRAKGSRRHERGACQRLGSMVCLMRLSNCSAKECELRKKWPIVNTSGNESGNARAIADCHH